MRADAEAKRQEVLDAAWLLFAQQGPDIALRAVAMQAGVGIGTLYRHFPTREDLVVGVLGQVRDRVIGVLDAADDWSNPEQTWHTVVHGLAELRIGALATQVIPYAQHSTEIVRRTRTNRREVLGRLSAMLDRARAAGLIGEVSPVQFMVGLAALSRPLPLLAARKVPNLFDWLVDVYIAGLRPGRADAVAPENAQASSRRITSSSPATKS